MKSTTFLCSASGYVVWSLVTVSTWRCVLCQADRMKTERTAVKREVESDEDDEPLAARMEKKVKKEKKEDSKKRKQDDDYSPVKVRLYTCAARSLFDIQVDYSACCLTSAVLIFNGITSQKKKKKDKAPEAVPSTSKKVKKNAEEETEEKWKWYVPVVSDIRQMAC